ncbi:MAG: class I SAM-dependent methyltransferase [Planctomycetes bacterium]|nr:class I SAM-dependent methyltransferase [Planctomycetota bacterium]
MTEDARDSAWRYDQGAKAARYRARSGERTRREAEILTELFGGLSLGSVLDVPCGAGRLAELVDEFDGTWIGADLSASMLEQARLSGAHGLLRARVDALPFAQDTFDTVICFRFLHHLRPRDQLVVLRELARVARRAIIVSAFSRLSLHGMRRRLSHWIRRSEPGRFALSLSELDGAMRDAGFSRTALARDGIGRDLFVARYEARS